MPLFSFLLASSHHHPSMNYHYIFLLLLVVLSAYSESPQYANLPDPPPIGGTVYPDSSSAQLGVLAPVLPQNEVYRIALPQNEVYKIAPPQIEVVLTPSGVFNNVIVNCQLFNGVKNTVGSLLNLEDKSFKFLTSTLILGGKRLVWTIRILLKSLQHVLKMYTWSLSENLASVQFRCRLIGLLLKQSLFRKHDFAILVHKACHDYQNLCFWPLNAFLKYKKDSHTYIKKELGKSTRYQFLGGGKALLFSSDELLAYASTDLLEQQYQFLRCVKKNQKNLVLNDGDLLCSVPLNILAPKLTLKTAKELVNLHDMYMPSKILLKDAQTLLENHKCETCEDLLAVFRVLVLPQFKLVFLLTCLIK